MGSSISIMPCLVALNWPQNWIFGIGNPNSVVWLYSELERGIENQFRAPPPRGQLTASSIQRSRAPYSFGIGSRRSLSLSRKNAAASTSFSPIPAGEADHGGAARYHRRLPSPPPFPLLPCRPSARAALPLPPSLVPHRRGLPVEP